MTLCLVFPDPVTYLCSVHTEMGRKFRLGVHRKNEERKRKWRMKIKLEEEVLDAAEEELREEGGMSDEVDVVYSTCETVI